MLNTKNKQEVLQLKRIGSGIQVASDSDSFQDEEISQIDKNLL